MSGTVAAVPIGRAPARGLPANRLQLLAVAHGTRDERGMAVMRELVGRVAGLRPEVDVRLACVGLAAPSVTDALGRLRGDVVVVPLLLGTGYHLRHDIPRALEQAPWVRARLAPALGPDPLLAHALAGRLAEAEARRPGAGGGPVVLAAAGSAEPAAQAAVAGTADLLSARIGRPVVPAGLAGSGPTPARAVAELRAAGHERVSVARYLLGPGHFARAAAGAGGCVLTEPLGAHEAVARLVLRRYDEAAATA
ncbi:MULTISPECIES: CbiX/SirB N-terminal domain-containing protein [Streptomyces]|uniref:Sirohydrochlorin chelatase n=1 Tax=Streptomyces luteosporeus TaxID=173856 RepID=A0ABN3TSW2_9ACTN